MSQRVEHGFAFQAIGPDGSSERGTVDAESATAARELIAARGLFVLSMDERDTPRTRSTTISPTDLALGLRILGDLLESGLPVSRALQAFQDLAPRGWADALPQIRQSIREGKSLASALASASIEIPALVIGIAEAGEAGSGIGPAIRRAAQLMEARADLRSATWSALAYPIVVACAGVGAISVLILVVLPRFAKILSDLGQTLPPSTQLVLRVAGVAHDAFLPATIGILLSFVVWHTWTHTQAGRRHWHRLLLSVPGLGSIRRGAASARVAHSLAALLESGVPIATSMKHAARSADDAELQARLEDARGHITSGQTLSQALASTQAVSTTTTQLIRAGEESGKLSSMLEHAARLEQQRVDRLVRAGIRMLEPVLLLTFASVVALVAAALLQAIYSVRPAA